MSRGAWEYKQEMLVDLSNDIENDILGKEPTEEGAYPKEVRECARRSAKALRRLAAEIEALDWYVSADTSLPTFLKEIAEIRKRR